MQPSAREVEKALAIGKALQKADALKPSTADYVSEGVLDHKPEADANGRINAKVRGNRNVIRMLQMNEAHYLAKGLIGQERQADIRRVPMRGRDGVVRMVAEEREDISGRKHGAVRLSRARWGRPTLHQDGEGRWWKRLANGWREVVRIEGEWVEL